jgi:Holliday junction DNA helicase RuvB
MADHKIAEVLAKPDAALEMTLRPSLFSEFTGQLKVKERLEITVAAAKGRKEAIDHVLFSGPPGLGKTTLAYILAKAMGASLKCTSGPTIEKAGDLAGLLTNLEEGDVLFIDEIHRLQKTIEEYLYPAMEDFKLDIVIGQGAGAQSIRLDLPRFTLIGATTRAGLLSSPLRDRFGWSARLEYYPAPDLERILARSARVFGVDLEDGACAEIAGRSRGTPRIANRLLRRVRDFSEVAEGQGSAIDRKRARYALERLDVDDSGFDGLDRLLVRTLLEKFDGGPVGIETLAAAVGEDRGTLEDVVEPYLIHQGFLSRTPRGRVATRLAREYFGVPLPDGPGNQQELL